MFSLCMWISMASSLKKDKVQSDLLTDIDILLMIEKCIIWGMCQAIHWYAEANNKYMEDYDINKELSKLKCWDVKKCT